MKRIEYKKILVTHDGSECASAVLPHVKSLANVLNCEILLLRVTGPFVPEFGTSGMPDIGPVIASISYGVTATEIALEVKKAAVKELDAIKKELTQSGIVNIKAVVLEGYAPEVILYKAKKEKIDMIVMSTHGRTGLKKLLIGSVAEQIIHSASCPVFIVHPNQKDIKIVGGKGEQ